MNDLTDSRLNLVEVRARQVAQGAPDDPTHRQQLAREFAGQYNATGEEILNTIQQENNSWDVTDAIYRGNIAPPGVGLRFFGGISLILASGPLNLIQGPNAATAAEVGIFLGATGVLDSARGFWLDMTSRNWEGINLASITNLIRRRASFQEGQITGDTLDNAQPINQELQNRLEAQTLAQLQLEAVGRPNLANPLDYSDILSQIQRPEYCGGRDFPNADVHIGEVTGGASDLSSWRGIAYNEWFKRIYRRDFVKGQDEVLRDSTFSLDTEGNERLIQDIVQDLKRKNPQIDSVTRDLFRHGTFYDSCEGELDRAFNNPTR